MNQNYESDEMEIDLIELLYILLRKWWLILLAAVIGMVAALSVTKFAIAPKYKSQAMLYVLTNTTSVTSVTDLQIGKAITGDFLIIATSKPTVDKAIDAIYNDEGIKFTRSQVLSMVDVTNDEDTRILRISATSTNPEYACMVANAMAEATAERMAEITKKDPPTTVEVAEVSKTPISPNASKNGIIGFLIGAVLVCAILVIQYLLNDNIQTEKDIEKYLGVPTLVAIPYTKTRADKKPEIGQGKNSGSGKGGKRGK